MKKRPWVSDGVMGRHKQGGEMEWKRSKGKCGMAVMVLICFSYSCRVMARVCINNKHLVM